MNKHPDDILTLMVEKLSGYINPEDDAWLENLIATNAEAREKWVAVQQSFPKEDINDGNLKLDNIQWADTNTITRRNIHVPRRRFSIAAAWIAAVLLIGAAAFLITGRNSDKGLRHTIAMNPLLGKSIRLRLANGQVISLSNANDTTYSVGGMQLTGNNKVLSYTGSSPITGLNVLTVPIGMDYNIHLSDGSVVYLNSATILSFPMKFTGSTREITINGEAYLEVAKDATHPFIVNLPHGSVQVLGTEFNVNSYDSGVVKVALVQGSVNMQMDNHTLHLTPGKEGVYKNNNLVVRPFDEQTTLGWRQGIYYFDNATLRQIVEVLPRWFGMQVQMDNEAKASEHFTGRVYRNQPITDFLDNLKSTTTVDYFIRDSVVHFR